MQQPPWDPEKERINQAKHGIGFDEARVAVNHPLARSWPDTEHSEGEARHVVMGWSPTGHLLFIITSLGGGGTMRIISARRATKRERHAYEDY